MQRQNCGKEVISVGGGSFFKRKFFIRVRMETEINDYGRIIKVGIRENFVVQGGQIYYVDYECSQYPDERNFENRGIKFWSKTKEFIGYAKGRYR